MRSLTRCRSLASLLLGLPLLLVACMAGGPEGPAYTPDQCVAVVEDGQLTTTTPTGCDGTLCDCDGGCADVVVENGEVVSVICYAADPSAVEAPDDVGNVSTEGTARVLVGDDGVAGDVNINAAEGAEVLGEGADRSIIEGNLNAHAGEVHLRGVTIAGDVSLNADTDAPSIVDSRILGNLNVHAEGFTAIRVEVMGSVNLTASGARLIDVGVQGALNATTALTSCVDVFAFEDLDGDDQVDPEERGADLCAP